MTKAITVHLLLFLKRCCIFQSAKLKCNILICFKYNMTGARFRVIFVIIRVRVVYTMDVNTAGVHYDLSNRNLIWISSVRSTVTHLNLPYRDRSAENILKALDE